METRSEVNRLKEAYCGYAVRGLGRSKWSVVNRGNQAMQQERQWKLHHLLQDAGFLPLRDSRVLDVGCGGGEILAGFEAWGGKPENLFGVDLLTESIRRAKKNFPEITFQEVNAEALPFANDFFDLVAVFTVFSSILDQQMARNVSREISRVLRSGGAVVWYDVRMNSPFNPLVRGISRGGIRKLFPNFNPRLITITLLPPLARRLGWFTERVYPWLASLPFLRSHHLGVVVKP